MAKIDVNGDIIPNDDKWFYDWLEYEGTCPNEVKKILEAAGPEEPIEVRINSGGGDVFAGQAIYSMLRKNPNVRIEIQSLAGSAASVIAMGGKSRISPVGMVMVHNVAINGASGDYHQMSHYSAMLKRMNEALASAYVEKSGMQMDDALKMMDQETWLTASQAVERGLVDGIMEDSAGFQNAIFGTRLTDELREKVMAEKKAAEEKQELLKDLDMFGV